jgi:CelD/BcsL family acetyltransferase involved in cellulose biosynthesis
VLTLHELADERAYEAELAECAGVTGYHRWFFLAALADALDLRLRAFAVADRGERLGAVPLLFRRRGPVSTVNYLPVPHVGPVLRGQALRAGQLPALLQAVEPILTRARVMVTKWAFAPGVDVPAGQLAARGFEVAQKENFVIPAAMSADDYLKALSYNTRATIRRAERRGMSAGPSTRDEITQWFPERVAEPYLRQGIAPDYSAAAARAMAARLADHPRMLWQTVRNDGRALAVMAAIVDTDRLWAWLVVGDRLPGVSPHATAYWAAIRWSLSRGLAFDMGGAPTSGIGVFKAKMGGQAELSVTAERTRIRAYKVARAWHGRLASHRARSAAAGQAGPPGTLSLHDHALLCI